MRKAPLLTLVRGVPGSGVTSAGAARAQEVGATHLHAGLFFEEQGREFRKEDLPSAHEWCLGRTAGLLARGEDVLVSGTFSKEQYIRPYRGLAEGLAARFEVVDVLGGGSSPHLPPREQRRLTREWRPYGGEGGEDEEV